MLLFFSNIHKNHFSSATVMHIGQSRFLLMCKLCKYFTVNVSFQIETKFTERDQLQCWFLLKSNFPPFQTNVYPAAQKRKARPFEGFQRRAVVVLPTDEIYKERVAAQKAAKEMDIPDEAIMEMKGIVLDLILNQQDLLNLLFIFCTFVRKERKKKSNFNYNQYF